MDHAHASKYRTRTCHTPPVRSTLKGTNCSHRRMLNGACWSMLSVSELRPRHTRKSELWVPLPSPVGPSVTIADDHHCIVVMVSTSCHRRSPALATRRLVVSGPAGRRSTGAHAWERAPGPSVLGARHRGAGRWALRPELVGTGRYPVCRSHLGQHVNVQHGPTVTHVHTPHAPTLTRRHTMPILIHAGPDTVMLLKYANFLRVFFS